MRLQYQQIKKIKSFVKTPIHLFKGFDLEKLTIDFKRQQFRIPISL